MTSQFRCNCCNIEISRHQWAFTRLCGFCDGSCGRKYKTVVDNITAGHWPLRYPKPDHSMYHMTIEEYTQYARQRYELKFIDPNGDVIVIIDRWES